MTTTTGLRIFLTLLLALAGPAAADLSDIHLETVATGLDRPVAITHAGDPGDGRLFITLRSGRIVIFDGVRVLPQPFLDIRDRVRSLGGEQGLLSVAFHPDYAANGLFFVDYTNSAGDTVITRYRVTGDPDVADPASEAILLTIEQPFGNHNGGQLQFGPDGLLYAATGDGGSANDPGCEAQDGDSLLGKLLRLDVDTDMGSAPFHAIPADNPFVGDDGVRDEIWATGLRNPWRFSFDRQTGDLVVADVGQASREEVDFQPAASAGGENYGWKMMEGSLCRGSTGCGGPVPGCDDPAYTAPVLEYDHGGGRCSITGGYVYRGSAIPELVGHYLYGDFCAGTLWAASRAGGSWQATELAPSAPGLTTFGEDAAGEVYLAAGSTLFRLAGPDLPQPGTLELMAASVVVGEGDGQTTVTVLRTAGSDGMVSVDWTTRDGTATATGDYLAAAGTLTWDDGESGGKTFTVTIVDDALAEDDESFTVELATPGGGAVLGTLTAAELTITDDDAVAEPCEPGPATLCLNGGRFRVEIAWRTAGGAEGLGQAVPLTPDSGYFWFFDAANPEIFVKVLDACVDPFNHFWVFAAGLTDVETRLTVVDTATGDLRRYDKPQGQGFDPIRDTSAFDCP